MGFVFAKFSIPTISKSPTTKIRGVSLTRAKKVFAIPGITNFKACGKITKICIFQYPIPRDFAASYCPRGNACKPPLITSATYAASNSDYDSVVINGSWCSSENGWDGWCLTLSDDDNDNIYEGTVDLNNGDYEYVIVVSGSADNWSGWEIGRAHV